MEARVAGQHDLRAGFLRRTWFRAGPGFAGPVLCYAAGLADDYFCDGGHEVAPEVTGSDHNYPGAAGSLIWIDDRAPDHVAVGLGALSLQYCRGRNFSANHLARNNL